MKLNVKKLAKVEKDLHANEGNVAVEALKKMVDLVLSDSVAENVLLAQKTLIDLKILEPEEPKVVQQLNS